MDMAATPEDRATQRLAMLHELADIGMEIARSLRVQAAAFAATAPEPAAKAPDFPLMFDRIARAVRRTLALQERLDEGRRKAIAQQQEIAAREVRFAPVRRKHQVCALVEEAIEAEAERTGASATRVESLLDDLHERLDDYDPGFASDTVAQMVAQICDDLGVTPDWTLWKDQDWFIEETAALRAAQSTDPPPSPPLSSRFRDSEDRDP